MTGLWDPQTEQWLWQRRAAAELVAILAAHRDLPAIAWTVCPAGCTLAGRVDALTPAAQVHAAFADWRTALGLHQPLGSHAAAVDAGGAIYLWAGAERHRVRLALTATVFDDEAVQL